MTKVMIVAAAAASATPIVVFQSCNTEVLSSFFFVFTVVMSMGGGCFCLIPTELFPLNYQAESLTPLLTQWVTHHILAKPRLWNDIPVNCRSRNIVSKDIGMINTQYDNDKRLYVLEKAKYLHSHCNSKCRTKMPESKIRWLAEDQHAKSTNMRERANTSQFFIILTLFAT